MPKFVTDLLDFFAEDGWFFAQHDNLIGILENMFQYLPAIILVAVGLLVLLVGKKILPLLKVLFYFIVGFVAAFQLLTPMICEWFSMEATDTLSLIVGIVAGIVAALLFKVLTFLLVIGVFGGGAGFGTYFLIENVPAIKDLVSDMPYLTYIIAGVVGLIVLLIAWRLLRFIEMLLTSVAGAGIMTYGIVKMYDFCEVLNWGALGAGDFVVAISFLAVAGVLALLGFIVQVKTRSYYY